MTELADLKNYEVAAAEVTLWTFKGTIPQINGHWVETTAPLDAELKAIFSAQLQHYTETLDYSLLAQNNEGSLLSIPADETEVSLIQDAIGQITTGRKTRDIRTLRNAKFYVLRLTVQGQTVFAVRKTDPSWRTQAAINVLSVFYKDRELDIAEDEGFRIHRTFDFFCMGDKIFVADKRNFESILSYRAAHEDDFAALQAEPEFLSIFPDFAELAAFVGTNRIQLRRMSAIRSKAFYRDEAFMANLRSRYSEFGLNIIFDETGKIVPTPETCRDIMTALLDHRLRSGFSGNTYDVPDTIQV